MFSRTSDKALSQTACAKYFCYMQNTRNVEMWGNVTEKIEKIIINELTHQFMGMT